MSSSTDTIQVQDIENQNTLLGSKRKGLFEDERSPKIRKPLETVNGNCDSALVSGKASSRIVPTLVSSEVSAPPKEEELAPPEASEEEDDEEYVYDEEYDEEVEENAVVDGEQADEVSEPLPQEQEEKEAMELIQAKGFKSHLDVIKDVGKNSPRYYNETVNRYIDIIQKTAAPFTREYELFTTEVSAVETKIKEGISTILSTLQCSAEPQALEAFQTVLNKFLRAITQAAYHFCENEEENEELNPETEVRVLTAVHVDNALRFHGLPIYSSVPIEENSEEDEEDSEEEQDKPEQMEEEKVSSPTEEEEESESESESDEVPEEDDEEDPSQPIHLIEAATFREFAEVSCPQDISFEDQAIDMLQDSAEQFLSQLIRSAQILSTSETSTLTKKDVENVVQTWSLAPGASTLSKVLKA